MTGSNAAPATTATGGLRQCAAITIRVPEMRWDGDLASTGIDVSTCRAGKLLHSKRQFQEYPAKPTNPSGNSIAEPRDCEAGAGVNALASGASR